MFERFSSQARQAVVAAQEIAVGRADGYIGTEHLLLALLADPDSVSAQVLVAHGLTADRAAQLLGRDVPEGSAGLDAEALDTIGIDLAAVRRRVEAAFGPGALDQPAGRAGRRRRLGHLPMTPRVKKSLELALREAIRLRHKEIGDGHLLLGVLRDGGGLARTMIVGAGIDPDRLAADLAQRIPPGAAAAG